MSGKKHIEEIIQDILDQQAADVKLPDLDMLLKQANEKKSNPRNVVELKPKEKHIDMFIKDILEDNVKEGDLPNIDTIIQSVNKEVKQQNRKKRLRGFTVAASLFLFLIIGGFIYSSQQDAVYTKYDPFDIGENEVLLRSSSVDKASSTSYFGVPDLETAQGYVSFKLRLPSYLPEGYDLGSKKIRLWRTDDSVLRVTFIFYNEETDEEMEYVIYNFDAGAIGFYNLNKDNDNYVITLGEAGDISFMLLETTDPTVDGNAVSWNHITWTEKDRINIIKASASGEELIKILESIK